MGNEPMRDPRARGKKSAGWCVYLLECRNGRLYTGITNDLAARFRQHLLKKGAMFTRLNQPSHILAAKRCKDRSSASKLEYRVKQLSAAEKRLLASQWPVMKDLPTSRPTS